MLLNKTHNIFWLIINLNNIQKLVKAQENPCPEHLTVSLQNASKFDDVYMYNGIKFENDKYYEVNNSVRGCICNVKNCVRKCCSLEKALDSKPSCVDRNTMNMTNFELKNLVSKNSSHLYLLDDNRLCEHERVPFNDFLILDDGSIRICEQPTSEVDKCTKMSFPKHSFCLEHYLIGDSAEYFAFVCVQDEAKFNHSKSYGMIISIPFLLATIIVYLLLPERNLHMKALIFYITCLMFAYIILVVIQLGDQFDDNPCKVIGFLCLFFFVSSIVWMNVICLDIFLTFSGFFGLQGNKKKENRRLIFYALYGFLFPFTLIIITFCVNQYVDQKSRYHPGIGYGSCFLKAGEPHILYFQGPVGILLLINIVLFALTAMKIRKAKKETKFLKKQGNKTSNENDNKKFNLYLKLLFAMGINWSMETISWIFETYTSVPRWVWYLTDFCNAIYGVFIFILFAFKKRHWMILKKRYYNLIGRPHKAQSLNQTQQTRTTMSESQTNGEMPLTSINTA